jgi:protein-tyrosine phosphatase
MGASRSVSIVIYYLMRKHNYSLNDSITFIRKKREIINPTMLFYDELTELETEIKNNRKY